MGARTILVAAALIACSSNSFATSSCRALGGCIDEASASFLAPIDVYERRCVELVPVKAHEYRELTQRLLRGEELAFLLKLRDSNVYRKVREDVETEFSKMAPQAALEACDAWLKFS